jgi:hypothetical protein
MYQLFLGGLRVTVHLAFLEPHLIAGRAATSLQKKCLKRLHSAACTIGSPALQQPTPIRPQLLPQEPSVLLAAACFLAQ